MVRILFNCDDFGRSSEINAAVLKAHREGVLGSASLMVTGNALSEAIEIARANPSLQVGLHLALSEMPPVLPTQKVDKLLANKDHFYCDPATNGIRLAWDKEARAQGAAEIEAQFRKFIDLGLKPAHVDGHHHLHMHPFIFRECIRWAKHFGFRRIRLVREFGNPFPPCRDSNQYFSKTIRHLIFLILADWNEHLLANSQMTYFNGVLGLWETGRMSEDYLLHAIPQLPDGDWEVYSHIGAPEHKEELLALLSPKLKELLQKKIEILKT